MKTLNTYKNIQTGEIFKIWETKKEYENHKGDFDIINEQI